MTHAECKAQLIDLIYGELAPEPKAQVEQHLAGCAECRAERDALLGTQAAFAPVMSGTDVAESEPGPAFDLPILAAAREMAAKMGEEAARAKSAAKPATLISLAEVRAAAAKQAEIAVPDSQRVRRKPQWMRATLVGSIAAAAALALIVSTQHTPDVVGVPPHSAEEMQIAEQKGAEVRVEKTAQAKALSEQLSGSPAAAPAPAQPPVPQELGVMGGVAGSANRGPQLAPPLAPRPEAAPQDRGAVARSNLDGIGSASAGRGIIKRDGDAVALNLNQPAEDKPAAPKRPFAPPPPGWANAQQDDKAKDADRAGLASNDLREGAGGSAGAVSERKRATANDSASSRDVADAEKQEVAAEPAPAHAKKLAPPRKEAVLDDMDSLDATPPTAAAPRAVASSMPPPPPASAPSPVAVASAPPPPAKSAPAPHLASAASKVSVAAPASPAPDDGPGLEAKAAAARASGQLREAGRLYREAAGAFVAAPSSDTSSKAAIDLVNAVACYARSGDLAEARRVRDLLVSLAPGQTSAIARANAEISAREAPPPAAASAPPASDR